jgi:23S rRNA maturation-related 3'-5' exoribonuclease YhaM
MNKEMWYTHIHTHTFILEEELNYVFCRKMDGTRVHHVQENKLDIDTEDMASCFLSHVELQKKAI